MNSLQVRPLLFPKPEAAVMMGISLSTLDREIHDGAIAIVRVRGRVMIAEADINGYISRKRIYKSDDQQGNEGKACHENVVTFGMPASKSKVGALKALLEGERRARTRFS